jgi:hypothetical protein
MLSHVALHRAGSATVWMLAAVFALGAQAEIVHHDFSGRLSAESRWYLFSGAHAGQRSHASGFVVAPKFYLEDDAGRSFTLAPFFRYDSADPGRTHADLREAYLLLFGEIGEDEWELRLGVDRVFWGVAESRHLVDIINQIDLVEHPYKEIKMGQPMAHLTWSGDWGALEVFSMPYHRARSFPGRPGRLRFPFVVDTENVSYESGAGQWHPDFATRYSHSFGHFDIGMSVFDGTSRDPFLLPGRDRSGEPAFVPYYEQIRQFGLDAQMTVGSWLFKLEAIQRSGARNVIGREENYVASVFGGEYTFHSVLNSSADLSLLGEWNYDSRGRYATNLFQNDLFLATRVAFNDVQNTEILASILGDADTTTRVLAVELNRRVSDRWSLRVESIALLSVDKADFQYEIRRDSYIELQLAYNF